jgi:hypothetical protein
LPYLTSSTRRVVTRRLPLEWLNVSFPELLYIGGRALPGSSATDRASCRTTVVSQLAKLPKPHSALLQHALWESFLKILRMAYCSQV